MESSIIEFYKNKTIFLTGFSGFLGQIVVERLLRCCDVKIIYVLIRSKKGKSWQNRVYEIFKDPLFDTIRKEKPDFIEKVVGVVGDCSLPNLGLNQYDIQTLQNTVNIVFHGAAVVKFDEKLSTALQVNVKATQCLMDLCKQMKQIQGFVYISTAYSNCNKPEIDEIFYKPKISALDMLHLLETMDEDLLNGITQDIIKGFPNTYAYSKNLAEDLVKTCAGDLPIVVFRPAIVMPSYKEPVSGWINNFYGPVGLMYGISMGAIHVFRLKRDNHAQLVPVDMTVSCLLASVWDIGRNSYQSIPVYNFVPKRTNPLTWGQFTDENLAAAQTFPTSKCYWYYAFETTEDPFKLSILHFLYHTLPAFFVDIILRLSGHKFRLMRLYRLIYRLNFVLGYFIFNKWTWHDNNVVELWNKMSVKDQENFFFNMEKLDWTSYIYSSLRGSRLYIAKDDPSTIPYSLKRQKTLKFIHYIFTYTVKGLAIYMLYLILHQIYFSLILPVF